MKYRCTGIRSCSNWRTLILLILLAWVSVSAEAQLFKPFTSFRVIKTNYFDIIFPKESESSARLLASCADRLYEQVSALLGIEVPGRIPVTFAPHTGLYNAYYNSLSGPHIVLYDTHGDLEDFNSYDSLESLFLHELAHAVSLNSRGPFFRGLHRVFGSWVTPTEINAPSFMREGAAVSLESLSGFGRANDPRFKQYLRQAVHEDKFLTPFQASGVNGHPIYDRPIHESHYEYGGLFSAWLQETYGMEKYAELWQAMGRDFYFSFFVYQSGYYHIFRKVYGVDFIEAWNAFSASLALEGLEANSDELLPIKYRFFSEKERFIQGLAAGGNELYFFDRTERKIFAYDTNTEKTRVINAGFPYDLDVSADSRVLLLSGYNLIGQKYSAIVTEHRADSGQKTGRTITGLYKARYFRDGVIGLRSDLHNTCIVYEDFDGKSETLFQGNEGLMFSGPQALDDERIAFIASRNGIRELWFYNYISRELFRIEDSSGGNEHWLYMRDLGVSEGKLFFSHNADDRMYKLACIDLEAMQAVFNDRDFSGGVFNPVSVNDTVYYLGAFFSRDSLLRFPEPALSLSGKRSDLTLVKLDNQSYEAVAEPSYSGASKAYFSLRYMNPLQCWFPLPLIRYDSGSNGFNISLDGGGFFSIITDPADRNLVTIEAYADIPYQMAMIRSFSWQNTTIGFPLTVSFSDTVVESGNATYRYTDANLSGSLYWVTGQWNHEAFLGGGYVRKADDDGRNSAYEWEETNSHVRLFAGLALSYRRLALRLSGTSFVDRFEPRFDGVFRANISARFPLGFTLFGAYDDLGMDLRGISNNYGERLVTSYALREYPHPAGLNLAWLAGGEIALNMFSFEIQKNISHAYFNRIYGTLMLRNQLYDSKGHPDAEGIAINDLRLAQSLMLKLNTKATFFPVVKTPASIEPYVLGAWKFSNVISASTGSSPDYNVNNSLWHFHNSLWYFTMGFSLYI